MDSKSFPELFVKNSLLGRIALFTMFLISMFMTLFAGATTFEDKEVVFLLLTILFVGIVFVLFALVEVKEYIFIAVLTIISLLIKIVFIYKINTTPISDFSMFYRAAEEYLRGERILLDGGYFYTWAYQTTIVIWNAFWIKFFNADVNFLLTLNCVFVTANNLLIYFIAKQFASKKAAQLAAFLYLIFPGTFFLISVLTNQHLSNFFLFLGVYLYSLIYSKKFKPIHKIILAILSSVALAIGDAFRPVGMIVVLAILCVAVYEISVLLIHKQIRFEWKKFLIPMITVVMFFVVTAGFSKAVQISGFNENGLKNMYPEWKFLIGFNKHTTGRFSVQDQEDYFYIMDEKERSHKTWEEVKNRMKIVDMLKLIYKKNMLIWGDREEATWAFHHLEGQEKVLFGKYKVQLNDVLDNAKKISQQFNTILYFTAGLSFLICIANKDINRLFLLLLGIAFLYFAAHCLVEVQVRYREFYMLMVFPITAIFYDKLFAICSRNK